MSHNFLNLVGKQFGRLVVIERTDNVSGRPAWICRCECGNSAKVMTTNLRKGHTQSCGCLQKERSAEVKKQHGKTATPIYSVWLNMLNRCRNKSVRSYKDYGGRGISVCERWKIFENFYADMGDIPLGKTLDRIDVNGNYEPGNCKWATLVEQQGNTRKNRFLSLNGKTQTISSWARETGINPTRIWLRLDAGWSVERALTTPIRKMKRKSEWQIPPRI